MKARSKSRRFQVVLLVLLAVAGIGARDLAAQMPYTRTSFTASYAPISVAGGATSITFASTDDGTTSVALPFAFTYAGTAYTTANFLAVCTNGHAFFSSASVTTPSARTNDNLYTTTIPNSTLAPWFDDLFIGAVGTNPAGLVLFQSQGVAGSRTLTVQWTDVSSYSTAAFGNPRIINFQVVLFETTNVIEFRYGTATGATYSSNESASIGIEDAVGGNNHYIDAVTGSGQINNGMMTTNKWPTRFFRFTPGVPATLAGGTYTVGSGGNYPSLTEAVADVNQRGIAAAVTLSLIDATYTSPANSFPILLGPIAGTSAAKTVTIAPASGTATLTFEGTVSGSCGNAAVTTAIDIISEPILGLIGSDYVTVRNLALTTTASAIVDRGILVLNNSPTDGATNNTIRDVAITLLRTNPGQPNGIGQNWKAVPASAAGANSGNHYYNLTIQNVFSGIQLIGNPNFPDIGTEVGTIAGGTTTIGGAAANDIGAGAAQLWGIQAIRQAGVRIFNCEVRNVAGATAGLPVDGIDLENNGIAAGVPAGTCDIFGNRIHDISSTGGVVTGMHLNLNANAGSVSRVFDNFIWGITSTSATTTFRGVIGIRVQDTAGGAGATHNIDFNSVRLEPAFLNCPNANLEIGTISGPVMKVRDNVLANFSGAQGGVSHHYCWVTPGVGSIGPAGSISEANVVYVANTIGGATGLTGAADRLTLADWRASVAQDAISLNENPQFISASNLHINPAAPTPVESYGSFFAGTINWVPTDLDADVRNASTPDIGADEGTFVYIPPKDIFASAFNLPTVGGLVVTNSSFSPSAKFTNGGTAAQTTIPVRFRITGPAPSTVEIYNQTGTIAALGVGAIASVGFTASSIAAAGTYTMYARSELPSDALPGNDELSGTFDVVAPLVGVYSVGAAQIAPFDSLTHALARLQLVGASGAVFFELTDPLYTTPAETFPLTITPYPGASASASLTIRPASGVVAAIQGNSPSTIVRLNGAHFVTLDGHSVGGTTRDLTISNTSVANDSAAVWLTSGGAGGGCTFDSVRNCNISCGADQSTVSTVTFAIAATGAVIDIGFGDDGVGQDDNSFVGNSITSARYGIYLRGAPGVSNHRNVISGNIVGSASFGAGQIGSAGILVQGEDQCVIDGNEVRFVGLAVGQAAPAADRTGIAIGGEGWPPSTWGVTNSVVTGNHVHDIIEVKSRSAVGIGVAGINGAGATSNLVANNMIHDVRANFLRPDLAVGVGIIAGNGDTVAHNSVSMAGDLDPPGAAAINGVAGGIVVGGAAVTNLTLVNNAVSMDLTSNAVANKVFAIIVPSAAFAWGTGRENGNDYWPNPANPQAVLGALGTFAPYTPVATLAAWKGTFVPAQDASSVSVDPLFASATDLHLTPGSPLNLAGLPFATVVKDFDGETRSATTPDIGCDEISPSIDVSATTFDDPLDGGTKLAGVSFLPKASFTNNSTFLLTNVPVRFQLIGPAPSLSVVYNQTATIANLPAGSTGQAVFPAANLLAGGTYTIVARSEQIGDVVPGNGQINGSMTALVVGNVASGSGPNGPLFVTKNLIDPTRVDLAWGASCGNAVGDYAAYEGSLGVFYGQSSITCTTAGGFSLPFVAPAGANEYWLVVPQSAALYGSYEGSYGRDSSGAEISPAAGPCHLVQTVAVCP